MLTVQAEDLTKEYGTGRVRNLALAGVTFGIEKGGFVSVMGPSGSGKTTLLQLLGAMDHPTRGQVVLNGLRLSDCGDEALSKIRNQECGFVFQSFNLIPVLTAVENVGLPLVLQGRSWEEGRSLAEYRLAFVGLASHGARYPHELSGGEQQRVALARALVGKPALLLADEPTGNLDSVTALDVIGKLRSACDEDGQTILLVTHDPLIASYADRVLFLKDGRLVDDLRPARGDAVSISSRFTEMVQDRGGTPS